MTDPIEAVTERKNRYYIDEDVEPTVKEFYDWCIEAHHAAQPSDTFRENAVRLVAPELLQRAEAAEAATKAAEDEATRMFENFKRMTAERDALQARVAEAEQEAGLWNRLIAAGQDGHFTVMKFTTNWRVCLETPDDTTEPWGLHSYIEAMPVGETFGQAARAALEKQEQGDL